MVEKQVGEGGEAGMARSREKRHAREGNKETGKIEETKNHEEQRNEKSIRGNKTAKG